MYGVTFCFLSCFFIILSFLKVISIRKYLFAFYSRTLRFSLICCGCHCFITITIIILNKLTNFENNCLAFYSWFNYLYTKKNVCVTCVYYDVLHAMVNLWTYFMFISLTQYNNFKKKSWDRLQIILLFTWYFLFFILLSMFIHCDIYSVFPALK